MNGPAAICAAALALAWLSNHAVSASPFVQCGTASWYAHAGRTASGEMADPNLLAAAYRTLPFGTRVEVENLRNRRTVIVRIYDRGPFIKGRLIDVSRAAAERLGFLSQGTTRVRIRELNGGAGGATAACP
jgi:rare lipoprotein A